MKKTSIVCFAHALLLCNPVCASAEESVSELAQIATSCNPSVTENAPAFQQMLVYVYQQNPRLASAREALKTEDEHVSEAVSGFRPTLNANGDLGRQREATAGQDWIYGTARDEGLVLSQPIFNGFGTFAQFHAAKARVSAARAHLTAVEEEVLLDAVTAYLEVGTRQYIVLFNRDNRTHLQSFLDATQKRVNAGDGTQTDLNQAQSRFAQAEASVATSEANWQSARASYQRATGLDGPSLEFPPFPEMLPARLEDAVALAQQAPEFTEVAEQERAASHDIDVASSALWPTVSVRGSMSDQLSPVLGLQNLRGDSIPLYEGGGEHARVREAEELREKAHDDMVDTSRAMTQRATQAWYDYQGGLRVIDATRKTAEAAYRALKGVEAEQQQGLRTVQETLDARAELLNALVAEVQAEENARLQAYRLLAATGQLTASCLHLDTPKYDPKQHYDAVADAWVGF